ncbi:hypothetical protein LSM04_000676 [Trypanosoma melophagium]|uniref:uncharacterized protein n=1 Tax=Trypanosoma melophagium TaxID=715481 RepID=UPI00351AAD9F|nr:hypothetical protein LSM04_000676 [Trypanosoma melophagium]
MPSCRPPDRPLPLGPRRTDRNKARMERWAQPLAPYMEPLPRGRITTTTRGGIVGNTAVPSRRSRSAATTSTTTTTTATTTITTGAVTPSAVPVQPELGQGTALNEGPPSIQCNSLDRLSGEERSICDLMVGVLQYKSAEEARYILAEVSQLAQSRRLLAQYSGVYGSNGDAYEINIGDRIRERARIQLIRQLQQQMQEEEEEREKYNKSQSGRDLNSEEEKNRVRWRKLFGRDDTNGNKPHSTPIKKKRSKHTRRSARGVKATQKEKQQQEQNQHEKRGYESKTREEIASARITAVAAAAAAAATSENTNTNTNTNSNTNTFGALSNIPRRVKRTPRIASFDESCANRYAADEGASDESAVTPSVVLQTHVNTPDDSVRQSASISGFSKGGDHETDLVGVGCAGRDLNVFNEHHSNVSNSNDNNNDSQEVHNDTVEMPSNLTATARPVPKGVPINTYHAISTPQIPQKVEKEERELFPSVEVEDEVMDEVSSASNSSISSSKSENKDREKELNEKEEEGEGKPSLTTKNGNIAVSNPIWELNDDRLPWEI